MNNFYEKFREAFYPVDEKKMNDKKRHYFYDNLKYVLITSVVIGHFISPYVFNHDFLKAIRIFTFLFNMPLFIFFAGLFSKKRDPKIVINFALLYLIFNYALMFTRYFFFDRDLNFNAFQVVNVSWFLFAMCIWTMFIPLIKMTKPVPTIIISIIIALLAGYTDTVRDVFAASRVIVFFPFFLAGFYVEREHVDKFLNKKFRIPSLMFIAALFLILMNPELNLYRFRALVSARNHYETMGLGIYGAFYRFAWYFLVILVTGAVMQLTPRVKTFYTKYGARTFQIFVFHYWLIFLFRYFNGYSYLNDIDNNVIRMSLYILIPTLFSFSLTHKKLSRPLDKIMGLEFNWLFK